MQSVLAVFLCTALAVHIHSAHASQNRDLATFLEIQRPWKGDLDGMVKRRYIRALVVHNRMFYFLDKGTQRGVSYEELKLFEKQINAQVKKKHLITHIVFIPVSRDELIPGLVAGRGDIAVANLTITPQRLKQVDFSNPLLTGVKELLVTGPAAPPW